MAKSGERITSSGYLREADVDLANEIAGPVGVSVTIFEPRRTVTLSDGSTAVKVQYELPDIRNRNGGQRISGMDISTRVDEARGRTDQVTGRPAPYRSPASRPHNYNKR